LRVSATAAVSGDREAGRRVELGCGCGSAVAGEALHAGPGNGGHCGGSDAADAMVVCVADQQRAGVVDRECGGTIEDGCGRRPVIAAVACGARAGEG
jgi:hypothetical protein